MAFNRLANWCQLLAIEKSENDCLHAVAGLSEPAVINIDLPNFAGMYVLEYYALE